MASKQFVLDEGTTITIYKRRGNRNLRLTITSNGEVRVSIPTWAPYSTGIQFAHERLDWIAAQKRTPDVLEDGQAIGKAHRLRFIPRVDALKPITKISAGEAVVTYPASLEPTSPSVQTAAQKVSIRALKQQAEQLLPQRLQTLASKHGFSYTSVSIKQLKSRWGSCDSDRKIVLNLYLMQLAWEYIDYVLIHELIHTEVLRHGPDFWQAFEQVLPDAKRLRKQMKDYHPVLHGPKRDAVA